MFRTTAISLILLLSVGVMLPFANSAHGVRQSAQVGQFRHHRYRSRAWWRRYRARMRKKRAAAELAHRNRLLSLSKNISLSDLAAGTPLSVPSVPESYTSLSVPVSNTPISVPESYTSLSVPVSNTPISVPVSGDGPEYSSDTTSPSMPTTSLPPTLNRSVAPPEVRSVAKAEAKTNAKLSTAKLPGRMNLAVVALSRPNPAFLTSREESKMLAGTNIADLRRIVIDKMLVAGGWVTNDFVREFDGARVFIVTARTPKDVNSPEKAWTFYFTEADGRIYGLTTDAPIEFADRMSTEAERFIASLRARAQSK